MNSGSEATEEDHSPSRRDWLRILPRNTLRFALVALIQAVYRIRRLNIDNIPRRGGALLLCNHVTYIDALILGAACPRDIRFVIEQRFMNVGWMGWFLRLFRVIPIRPGHSRDAIRLTVEALRRGELVCLFPEGQLTRTGLLNEIKKGFQLVVRDAGVPVIPVYIDALWGSIFSFERERFFRKIPRRFPYGVTVNFGEPIAPAEVTPARVRQSLQELSVDAFATRRPLREPLASALRRALKKRPGREALVDLAGKRLSFPRAALLGTAEVIAAGWRQPGVFDLREERVGILLPHSAPSVILELALVFSGRVPVVFSLASTPAAEDLARWGISSVISSERVRKHLPNFPWPRRFIDMAQTFRDVPRGRLLLRWLAAYAEPPFLALARAPRQRRDPESEVAGYVHRLPSGEHALVTCSSRQLIANVEQIAGANFFRPRETFLSEAPASTAEGNLFSLWYPLLSGSRLVTVSLALEDQAMLELLESEKITAYLPRPGRWKALAGATRRPSGHLRTVLSFDAAATGAALRAALERALGATLAPGSAHPAFGVVVSLSMPDPGGPPPARPQSGARDGSVGRLLPGFAARVLCDGSPPAALGPHGPLELRSACLPAVVQWVDAGQKARLDQDGFLYLD